jgi:hypothetical protein
MKMIFPAILMIISSVCFAAKSGDIYTGKDLISMDSCQVEIKKISNNQITIDLTIDESATYTLELTKSFTNESFQSIIKRPGLQEELQESVAELEIDRTNGNAQARIFTRYTKPGKEPEVKDMISCDLSKPD